MQMIYCVIGDDETEWEGLIRERFPDDEHLKIGPCQWLVHSDVSTSKTVWQGIVGEGDQPTGMVFPVRGYYGYRDATVWEWMAAKRTLDNGD